MAVGIRDLLTVQELQDDMFESSSLDFVNNYRKQTERIISDVTDAIEEFLDRKLIVDKYKVFPDWRTRDRDDHTYQFIVRDWPIVEIITSNVSSIDNRRIGSDTKEDEVEYYAGYKRSDQTLGDLQAELSGLSVEPGNLPGSIRRCAVALCVYEINRAVNRVYGRQSTTTSTGDVNVTITKEKADVYADELRKIETLKILN